MPPSQPPPRPADSERTRLELDILASELHAAPPAPPSAPPPIPEEPPPDDPLQPLPPAV